MCRFGQKQHRSVLVSATQEADLEFGAGERRLDQPWVIAGGEENIEKAVESRERLTNQENRGPDPL
jgi:hypothetical protein